MEGLEKRISSRREMHIFWLLKSSSTMRSNIQEVSELVDKSTSMMRKSPKTGFMHVLVRVLKFATKPEWLVARPTPLAEFEWKGDLTCDGGPEGLGEALAMVAAEINNFDVGVRHAAPPILVLVTDGGYPRHNFESSLQHLLATRLGRHVRRVAVLVGRDDVRPEGLESLTDFVGKDGPPLLRGYMAANALAQYILA